MNTAVAAPEVEWEAPKVELNAHGQKIYRPDGAVLQRFLKERPYFGIIQGPIGSGTSTACCLKIYTLACQQKPGPDGKRRTRFAVVRNTFPELQQTTLKTWLYWFPENLYGIMNRARPYTHPIRVGDVECEVVFIALDSPDDVQKLLSMELTGIFYNEMNFLHRSIVQEGLSRCGRYPPMAEGGPTWFGGFADMNAPNEDHWTPQMFGDVPIPDDLSDDDKSALVRPVGWERYVQPSGLIEVWGPDGKTLVGYKPNPLAENTKWLPPGYYVKLASAQKRSWIDSRIMNRISLHVEGEAVFPQFRSEVHVAREPLRPLEGSKLVVGLDFGRRPAAIFLQRLGLRWIVLGEYGMIDVGASTFAPALKREIATRFPGFKIAAGFDVGDVVFWGDPKGNDKVQSDEQTAYQIFRAHGMWVRAAPVPDNNIQTRLNAVESALTRLVDTYPGLLISPNARTLKVALAGGYHWAKGGDGRTEPKKDRYSDFADALGYGLLGGGEGRAAIGKGHDRRAAKPVNLRPVRRSLRRG